MLNKDVFSLLGLASCARKITTGDVLIKDIRSHKVNLVLIAEDASDNTKKKITDKCIFYKISYIFIESSEDLSRAIGKDNRMAVGILDRGFADKIKSKLGG